MEKDRFGGQIVHRFVAGSHDWVRRSVVRVRPSVPIKLCRISRPGSIVDLWWLVDEQESDPRESILKKWRSLSSSPTCSSSWQQLPLLLLFVTSSRYFTDAKFSSSFKRFSSIWLNCVDFNADLKWTSDELTSVLNLTLLMCRRVTAETEQYYKLK